MSDHNLFTKPFENGEVDVQAMLTDSLMNLNKHKACRCVHIDSVIDITSKNRVMYKQKVKFVRDDKHVIPLPNGTELSIPMKVYKCNICGEELWAFDTPDGSTTLENTAKTFNAVYSLVAKMQAVEPMIVGLTSFKFPDNFRDEYNYLVGKEYLDLLAGVAISRSKVKRIDRSELAQRASYMLETNLQRAKWAAITNVIDGVNVKTSGVDNENDIEISSLISGGTINPSRVKNSTEVDRTYVEREVELQYSRRQASAITGSDEPDTTKGAAKIDVQ